jgi:predicted phosphoribosyltransferase
MARVEVADVIELPQLRDRTRVFDDRDDAGRVLAGMLEEFRGSGALVLGVPSGGVPVGMAAAGALGLEFDVAVVSKITLPWNSEMGYGAVAFDGTVRLNEPVLASIGLSEMEVREGIRRTRQKVRRRVRILRGNQPLPDVNGRDVLLVDDGLATGSTLRAAVAALRRALCGRLVLAVPTGHEASVHALAAEVDGVYCANVRGGWSYAVADAYRHWTDMTEIEVARLLAEWRGET